MNEADVKRNIVKDFKVRGNYARRIEDAYSVGFPDLILIPKDYPVFFTEAKIIKGQTFGPTDRQYVEMTRLAISKYSVPVIIGWKERVHYLHEYAKSVTIEQCLAQQPDENIVDFFKRFYNER